ncbi:MAG: glycosyltransferase family 39 protein, partial [Chloroflexota bacterium]
MYHSADSLMWGDEGFSIFSAHRDLLTITLDTTTIDPHPPLYTYLLHFYFVVAGYSEFAVRFFSIFFGTATIALTWVIGKRM